MSLIAFHRLLIAVGILFCGGYALWELTAYVQDRSIGSLLLTLAFAAGAAALGYYLRHLARILRLDDDPRGSRGPSR